MKTTYLNFLILGILCLMTHFSQLQARESTATSRSQNYASAGFDDRTCPSGGKFGHLCCYKNIRYNCSFLFNQFRANLCRPNPRDFSSNSWKKCNLGVPDVAAYQRRYQPMMTQRPSNALDYAADLTACGDYGVRNAGGSGYCARGVRYALACMANRRGKKVGVWNFHCGESAYDYYGKGCLEKHGFVRDMNSCNTPGVVRVYYGYQHKNPSYNGGDRHGHIEFLGTNGLWYAGAKNASPIDSIYGRSRRILKACYVLPNGKI